MIKKLRLKFICIMMAIVILMVGAILGVVIHFTSANMEMQSVNMMRAIASAPFHQGHPGKPDNDEVRLPCSFPTYGARYRLDTSAEKQEKIPKIALYHETFWSL